MKQCPQCRQYFSDDTHFCLSDGTPLIAADDTPEEMTVIRPQNIQPTPPSVQKGASPIFVYLTVGLLLLLLIGGVVAVGLFALSRMSGGNTNVEIAKESNKTPSGFLPPKKDNEQEKIDQQKANLQQQQDQLEKEKQRLADERKKLNEDKNKPVETPVPTPPPPATPYPAQPTARIKFGRGRVSESVSGKIYTERSFVLQARSGQYLSAAVSGGGCVTFSNGGTSFGYVTSSGDNRINLVNNCRAEASFSLTVSIR